MACAPGSLEDTANRIRSIQEELKRFQTKEMDTAVPALARDQLTQLKDALRCAADVALTQAGPSADAVELQNQIGHVLSANRPAPADNPVVSGNDQTFGTYAQELAVSVSRSLSFPKLLEIRFSMDIPCGDDNLLLVYVLENGAWRNKLRWQAPPLKEISEAFGDFFVSTMVSANEGGSSPRIVVAHGTPWCTSRFSGFAIDVLAPSSDPSLPKILWHTQRGYSRGDFSPTLRSSRDTFELRVNESALDGDSFERRVIYQYRLDEHQGVRRIEPIALNARGFVEEWLSAPWPESKGFSAPGAASALHIIHDQFAQHPLSDSEFVTNSYGPVRACDAPGGFQVEIRSTLEKIVPGKPGGESRPLPTRYFHLREVKDGYLVVSAPSEPDPGCKGADLMRKAAN